MARHQRVALSATGCCYPSKFGGRRGLDLPHQILERLFCVRFSGMAARDVPSCTSVPGRPSTSDPPPVGAGVDWGLDQRGALATPEVT